MKTLSIAVVSLVAAMSGSAAFAQQSVNVLTGSASGVYYPLGVALAKIYSDIPDVKVQVQTTEGAVENLLMLQQGSGQIGFAPGDALNAASSGDAKTNFNAKLDKLRVIAAIYPDYIQIVALAASGIGTLADLKGKSLSVGASKSGTELSARAILSAAGLSFQDLGRVEFLSFSESITAMKDKKLDATLQSSGLGAMSLTEISNASDVALVAVPRDVVEKAGGPFFPATIPANSYAGQITDVPTAAVMNYLVTSAAVPDDLVYQMTKMMFDSLPQLANAHPTGRNIRLETAARTPPVPLHPGAIRFYREKGLLK